MRILKDKKRPVDIYAEGTPTSNAAKRMNARTQNTVNSIGAAMPGADYAQDSAREISGAFNNGGTMPQRIGAATGTAVRAATAVPLAMGHDMVVKPAVAAWDSPARKGLFQGVSSFGRAVMGDTSPGQRLPAQVTQQVTQPAEPQAALAQATPAVAAPGMAPLQPAVEAPAPAIGGPNFNRAPLQPVQPQAIAHGLTVNGVTTGPSSPVTDAQMADYYRRARGMGDGRGVGGNWSAPSMKRPGPTIGEMIVNNGRDRQARAWAGIANEQDRTRVAENSGIAGHAINARQNEIAAERNRSADQLATAKMRLDQENSANQYHNQLRLTGAQIGSLDADTSLKQQQIAQGARAASMDAEYRNPNTTPERRKELAAQIRALSGKEAAKYQIVTREEMGPDGITPTRTPYAVDPDDPGNATEIGGRGAVQQLPPTQDRVKGRSYNLPQGRFKWTGKDWVKE